MSDRKMDAARNLQFVLRYSDDVRNSDTVAEHAKVLRRTGRVWLGKFGVGSARPIVSKANTQVAEGIPTYVYLSSRSRIQYRGRIAQVVGGGIAARVRCPEPKLSPQYYAKTPCSMWFLLKSIEEIDKGDLARLRLYNAPWMAPTYTSMRGLVYVTHSASETAPVPRAKSPHSSSHNNGDFGLLDDLLLEDFE